jgi:hypothetical protein
LAKPTQRAKPIEKAKPLESDDLTKERPTAPIDPELLKSLLEHKRAMRQMLFDFIIDLIDHGAGPVIIILGLLVVVSGHGSATDVRTIIGGITTGGGAVGTGVQLRRRQQRQSHKKLP